MHDALLAKFLPQLSLQAIFVRLAPEKLGGDVYTGRMALLIDRQHREIQHAVLLALLACELDHFVDNLLMVILGHG